MTPELGWIKLFFAEQGIRMKLIADRSLSNHIFAMGILVLSLFPIIRLTPVPIATPSGCVAQGAGGGATAWCR